MIEVDEQEIRGIVRNYVLSEFLENESEDQLMDSTPLISGGILDSISTTRLVVFLESKFGIVMESTDVKIENLDTVELIVDTISRKLCGL